MTGRYHLFTPFLIVLLAVIMNADLSFADSHVSNIRCPTPPKPVWTEQEQWVWQQICTGGDADLVRKYPGSSDPKGFASWPKKRVLSAQFFKTILRKPYSDAISDRGIYIYGALFSSVIDLTGVQLKVPVFIFGSKIPAIVLTYAKVYLLCLCENTFIEEIQAELLKVDTVLSLKNGSFKKIVLRSAHVGGQLNLNGVMVDDLLDMSQINIGESLPLNQGQFKTINLNGATVGGQLNMVDTMVDGQLVMDNIHLKAGAILGNEKGHSTVKYDIALNNAQIDGQLGMVGVVVDRILNIESSKISNSLSLKDSNLNHFNMSGTDIAGQLDMTGATVKGVLNFDIDKIGNNFLLDKIQLSNPASIHNISVGSYLTLSGHNLPTIDLTGSTFSQGLRFGSKTYGAPTWLPETELKLRNVSTLAIQDRCEDYNQTLTGQCKEDPWPKKIEMEGFTFKQFGIIFVDNNSNMSIRTSDWWIDWLGRNKLFSPQPYQIVAAALRNMGQPNKADEILYEGKNAERRNLPWCPPWQKLFLGAELIFIGYGYKTIHYTLLWFLAFVGFGSIFLHLDHKSRSGVLNNFWDRIFYSIDTFLPGIKLNEKFSQVELSFWTQYYFYFHKIMGYVIIAFLLAGLTGLTKG